MEKKPKYLIITLCCVLGLIIGSTTAWYVWRSSDNTDVTFTIGGMTITYHAGDDISGQNLRPTASKEVGITNNYAILKNITVSSNKQAYLNLYLTAEMFPEILSQESLKWEVYEDSTLLKSGNFSEVQEGNKITLLKETEINNITRNISLYIWIDGTMENPSEMSDQEYKFILSADASDKLPASLLTLTNLGLTEYLNEGTPNFANIATIDEGIYETEDDLGMSYYFRGASEHNYVKFGEKAVTYIGYELEIFDTLDECEKQAINCYLDEEGYLGQVKISDEYTSIDDCLNETMDCVVGTTTGLYWRIIRINGDGTIRMIYADDTPYIGEYTNYSRDYSDNTFVGYMYNESGQTTYELTHKNVNDSKVKGIVEDWYLENFYISDYEKYIVDAIYCNDRKPGGLYGKGIGATVTSMMTYVRHRKKNPTPSLKCEQKNDRFTKSPTLGNGMLRYPIGLITADEAVFAGGKIQQSSGTANNTSYYLYAGVPYWTMSPAGYLSGTSGVYSVNSNGGIDDFHTSAQKSYVRPVISIKGDVIFTGDGSYETPFEIAG